jgi:hypothetical protein
MVNPYGLTDDAMILLEAMDLQERCSIHGEVDKRPWRKEGKHHGCGRHGRRAFLAGYVPIRSAEGESDLPWDDCRDE